MDYKVEWSPEAHEDVESIASYIARDSKSYAASVVGKILESTRNFSSFPYAGRIVPELEDSSTREQFVYSYRVIYQIKKTKITIVAVIHGKRLLGSVKDRLPNE